MKLELPERVERTRQAAHGLHRSPGIVAAAEDGERGPCQLGGPFGIASPEGHGGEERAIRQVQGCLAGPGVGVAIALPVAAGLIATADWRTAALVFLATCLVVWVLRPAGDGAPCSTPPLRASDLGSA